MKKTQYYLWWLLLFGLIGGIVYWHKADKVFPSASIDLKIPQSQILAIADHWKDKCDYKESDKTGVIHSTVFSFDDDAKTFLEYELGQSRANDLMHDTVPVWYWSTRFCKPLKQEEFMCWISPGGQLISYDHSIENDLELPSVSHEEALSLGQQALLRDSRVDVSGYTLIEDGSIDQVHRTDHYFTWEDRKLSLKGAKLRAYAYVAGNEVTQINHFLYIPESWKRKFSKLRSYNDALEGIASIFYTALTTGVFFVFLWAFANGHIRWRFSLIVALLYSAFAIFESINSWPSSVHEYSTTLPWDGFVMEFVLAAIWSGISSFFQIFTLTAAVEALYRIATPNKVSLERTFSWSGLATRQTFESVLAGLGTFGLHLGWLVIYYLSGRAFGLWCPLEVENVETLSTTVPAFSAINVGFLACLTEEMTYRVLGLTMFQRLVKNFWLANLLQAAAWAFMHSNYPQEPPYARGLELTVVGTIYGAILRRYGLLACLLSHNMLDSFLGLAPLFTASAKSLQLSAYLAILPFALIIGLPIYFRIKQKGFTPEEGMLNLNFTKTKEGSLIEEVKHGASCYVYTALGGRLRIVLAIIIALAAAVQLGFFFPTIGSLSSVTFSREEAIKKATEVLAARDLRPDKYSSVAWLISGIDLDQFQYIYEKDRGRVNAFSENPETPLIWYVRFYKPNSGNEYSVSFDGRGKLLSVDVTQEEDEAGANLTKEEARKLVETYFQKLHPEMLPYQLETSTEQKKDKRTDWTFNFKIPQYKVGQADYKVTIKCIGEQPSGFSSYWSIPDQWKFQRALSFKNLREEICTYVPIVIGLIASIFLLLWARDIVRASALSWRPAIVLGLVMAVFSIIHIINAWPVYFSTYDTDSPLLIFFVKESVADFVTAIIQFSMMTIIAAFGIGSLRLFLPRPTIAAILQTTFTPNRGKEMATNRQMWLDATLIGYAVGIGWQAINIILAWSRWMISPDVTTANLSGMAYLSNYFDPAIAITFDAIGHGLEFTLTAGILVGVYAKYVRNFRRYLLLSLILSLLLPSAEHYRQEYVLHALSYFLSCLIIWCLVAKLAKENFLAYFIAAYAGNLVTSLRSLVAHGRSQYLQDIISTTVVLLIPLGYVLYASLNIASREREQPEPNPLLEP